MNKSRIRWCFWAVVVLLAVVQTGCHSHHEVRVAFYEDFGAPGSVFVITGAWFDPDAVVWFDGSSAAVYVGDSTRIYGVVPNLPPGVVEVFVTNPTSGISWGPLLFDVVFAPVGGDIDGFAYFPYEDPWGNYPVYYSNGNELILVTLYDADDIHYMFPLRDYLTDTDGYFYFPDVTPDWYFLTAEAVECDVINDIADYYWSETPNFDLLAGELRFWELYLSYDGWEYGCPRSAALMKSMSELGPGEMAQSADLEQLRAARSERFRLEGRQRPIQLQVKGPAEQTGSEIQQD